MASPVWAFHSQMVESVPDEARNCPSALKATEVTMPPCRFSPGSGSRPVSTSITATPLAPSPDASHLLSWLKEILAKARRAVRPQSTLPDQSNREVGSQASDSISASQILICPSSQTAANQRLSGL